MTPVSGLPCWADWKWQQRHSVTTLEELVKAFPGLAGSPRLDTLRAAFNSRRVSLTPYSLRLVETDAHQVPLENDPIWLQTMPEFSTQGPLDYDGKTENWEQAHEMVTDICQHKYDNRVIIRASNVCHAYCQFCYEALRTLERHSAKPALKAPAWQATLDYLAATPSVEEAILSGGEPLMLSDARLDTLLGSLRAARPDIIVRVHTRALTFNPFRVNEALLQSFARHGVVAVGLHVAHPRELTPAFFSATRSLQRAVPLLFANIPFLGGINDNLDTLRALCMGLYRAGITPHYLYQFMPFSPGHGRYAAPARQAIELLRQLKRHISNLAVPELVIAHLTGKHTLPLELGGPATRIETTADGVETIHFTNWRGEPCVFPQ